MKIIISLFSEISIKSKPVRRRLIGMLRRNMAVALRDTHEEIEVKAEWDRLVVNCEGASDIVRQEVYNILKYIPGIQSFREVKEYPLSDFEDILVRVLESYNEILKDKTFCVRVKRSGEHDFKSLDLERFLGGGILRRVEGSKVKLVNPDIEVKVEVRNQILFVVQEKVEGVGGFPVGAQGRVLSLISGGYDSPVASYLMMKRGCKVDYLFFNLGGKVHEVGVKEMCHHLSNRFSKAYGANLIVVPFEDIVAELVNIKNKRYRGVLLKRFMFKVANMITSQYQYEGLVTGESLGQVSSQTLTNLNTITEAADSLVFRPVVAMDKQDIIAIANRIEVAQIAETMPEYCAIGSGKPATAAKLDAVQDEEKEFDHLLLVEAFEKRSVMKVDDINIDTLGTSYIETVTEVADDDTIIDIREKDEQEKQPLKMENVLLVSFHQLKNKIPSLDKDKSYLLYCSEGVMSRIHALELKEQGFEQVKVLRIS